jgi:nucleotide-binding universal stress UspA family protein
MLGEALGAEIHLLHVISYRDELPPTEKELRRAVQGAEKKLKVVAASADVSRMVTAVRIGSAHGEVVHYVKDHKIDLVVMGTVGMSAEHHLPVGSTADRVIRSVSVPVLTVKGPAASTAPARRCALCGAESLDVVCDGCKERVRGEATHRHRGR